MKDALIPTPRLCYHSLGNDTIMLSSISGLAQRLSSYVREPLTLLGSAVQNGIFTDQYSSPDYPTVHVMSS